MNGNLPVNTFNKNSVLELKGNLIPGYPSNRRHLVFKEKE